MINLENIDLYWDDFANGLLNEEQELAIMELLESNPDLLERLPGASPEPVTMPEAWKNQLHQASLEKLDWLLVAELEDCISQEEQNELNAFEQHFPNVEQERKMMRLTKLEADESIKYLNKKALVAAVPLQWWKNPVWLAAASVVLLMAVWWGSLEKPNHHLGNRVEVGQDPNTSPNLQKDTQVEPEAAKVEQEKTLENKPVELGRLSEESQELQPHKTELKMIAAQWPQDRKELDVKPPSINLLAVEAVDVASLTASLQVDYSAPIEAPSGRSFTPSTWVYEQVKSKVFKQKSEAVTQDIPKDLLTVAQEKVLGQNVSIEEGKYRFQFAGYKLEYSAQR